MFLILFLLCGCEKENTETISFITITSEEAMKRMEEETDFLILDVRTKEEYEEGHINDAINIPNEVIEQEAESFLKDKGQTIYVYCRSGRRSKQACQTLCNLGYTHVIDFGGIIDWKGEIVK